MGTVESIQFSSPANEEADVLLTMPGTSMYQGKKSEWRCKKKEKEKRMEM